MEKLFQNLPETLCDKRILIAGGTSGTGRKITLRLSAMGAKLMVLGEKQSDLDETMTALRAMGCESNCYGMLADPSNPLDISVILTVIDRYFRGLDILIINEMFILPDYMGDNNDTINDIFQAKLQGQFLCSKELIKRLERTNDPQILNVYTIGKDLRSKYRRLCEEARNAFRMFNSELCKEAENKNVKVILSTV